MSKKSSKKEKLGNADNLALIKQEIKKLKEIYLINCRQSICDPIFSKQLDHFNQQDTLPDSFAFKNIPLGSNTMDAIVSLFSRRNILKRIELTTCELALGALIKMTRLFTGSSSSNLTSVKLVNCNIDSRKAAKIGVWLASAQGLQDLVLDYNPIGSIGASCIFRGIQMNEYWRPTPPLPTSDTLMQVVNKETSKKNVKSNYFLNILSLKYCKIETRACEEIQRTLMLDIPLISLDLTGNLIGSEGILQIAAGLEVNKELSYLNLSGNQVGMQFLEEGLDLPKRESLDTLGIVGKSISSSKRPSFRPGTAIPVNTVTVTVTEKPQTAPSYKEVMSERNTLEHLKPLLSSLEKNTQLLHLALEGNHFEDRRIYAEFLALLKTRKTLAQKKQATPLAITCSERQSTEIMVKIMDANKQAFTAHKKLKKKRK